jgi:HK97 family phage major capsid protein
MPGMADQHTMVPVSRLPEGTAFGRFLLALAASEGFEGRALQYATDRGWERSTPHVVKAFELQVKALVAPGDSTTPAWAGSLAQTGLTGEALSLLRGLSLVDQVAGKMQRVAYGTTVPVDATAVPVGGWIAEGAPIPMNALSFASVGPLRPAKVAAAIAVTRELISLGGPTAERSLTTSLLSQVAAVIDKLFLDPAVAPAGAAPGSITNGATEITSSGATAAQIQADLAAMIAAITTTGKGFTWMLRPTTAAHVAAALGSASDLPRSLYGLPVALSANSPRQITLADLAAVLVADDGVLSLDITEHAAVQMDSAPTHPATAATVFRSLYQENLIGVKAVRWITWLRAVNGSVAYMVTTY